MNDFREALEWAEEYGIDFQIVRKGETLAVRASRGRVSSNYIIDMAEPDGFRGAIWAAITSVRAGVEYHSVHGYAPGFDTGESPFGT